VEIKRTARLRTEESTGPATERAPWILKPLKRWPPLGIGVMAHFLLAHESVLRLGGRLVLCVLGARSLRAEAAFAQPGTGAQGLVSAFASTFLLTLSNPLVLLTIASVSTALGLAAEALDPAAAAAVVLGVCTGSLLWWLVLLSCVRLGSHRFNERTLRWVFRGSGGLLLAAGLGLLGRRALLLKGLGGKMSSRTVSSACDRAEMVQWAGRS
jgi:threonine/homoserine/homoserine lactone efflux protein